MPFAGLGIHIFLALFCAYHVVRSGQQLYWLFILFAFPLFGSIIYFFAVYLPNSRIQHGAVRAASAVARALDPSKEVRLARMNFEDTPTAQNQMILASALLQVGQAEEAANLYESALKGLFASDPDIRYGAANSYVECNRFADALIHLQELQKLRPEYRPDGVSLLIARSYAGLSKVAEARKEFKSVVDQYGTFEARAEYAIWALSIGDTATAAKLQYEIDAIVRRWNTMNRKLNDRVYRRLKAAQTSSIKSS